VKSLKEYKAGDGFYTKAAKEMEKLLEITNKFFGDEDPPLEVHLDFDDILEHITDELNLIDKPVLTDLYTEETLTNNYDVLTVDPINGIHVLFRDTVGRREQKNIFDVEFHSDVQSSRDTDQ